MQKIKVAQIGIGHNHGSEKMASLRRLSDVFDVVAVAEDDPLWRGKRQGFPEYAGLEWMSEDEILGIPGLQAVTVEKNDPGLVATARKCAERGLHMHMDKPGGETLPPFQELLDACGRNKAAIQLGYMYRYNPAILFIRDALRKGWLGDIFEIHAVMSRYDGQDYRNWLSSFKGGAMYIFGGHLIDIIISMLGRPGNVVPFQRKTRGECDALYDNGFAVLEYPRATASVRTTVAEVDGMRHRRLIVCGTRGTAEVCPLEPPASHYRLTPLHVRLTLLEDNGEFKAGTHDVEMPVMNGRYDSQIMEFARIIRGEIENPYPYEHEFLVQEALLAAAGYGPFPVRRIKG